MDTRRKRKDGMCPIIFRLSHHRKTIAISTGFAVPPEYWNEKNREVKKTYNGVSSVARLNNLLTKKKTELRDGINELEENGQLGGLSITDLKRFETAHLKKGNSINGLSMYMRTFRAIYNKAIHQGIVPADSYPFRKYKIKSEPTAKRAISKEKIKRILDLKLDVDSPLFNARNYFLCSYLMNGISFIDIAFLKVENIIDGRIQYRRQKTARHYDIKVTPQLSSIMDHYLMGKDKTTHIFPIVKRKEIQDQFNNGFLISFTRI